MNSMNFSPRMTRSKSKKLQQKEQQQQQQQQQQSEYEVTLSECQQMGKQTANVTEEDVHRKTSQTRGPKSRAKKKVKKSSGEMNSILANKGSLGSFSVLQTPTKCEDLMKHNSFGGLLPPRNDICASPGSKMLNVKSPKIGTISADTPERSAHFYRNIESIRDCRLRILGKGSFGTIIQATYKGELVAVKIVPPHKSNTLKNELNNFFLSHPNIVKTLRIISNEDVRSYCLVIMEMCSSVTLENLVHEDSYNLKKSSIIRYMIDISRALEHCHSQRVLHLDVKPKNILVNVITDACKLCDFGSSCLLMGEDDAFTEPADYETLQNTAVYTCPELLTGAQPTDKADVYSYGITLWQVVHGERPYVVDSKIDLQSTIYKVVKQKKRPQKKFKNNNDHLEKLYTKCWDHDPDNRPTMKEIVQYLEELTSDKSFMMIE